MGTLHRVVCLLLEERVPVSHLTQILESLAHHAPTMKDPVALAERCRIDLGRAICERFRDERGRLHVFALDPRLEVEFRRSLHDGNLVLDGGRLEKMVVRLINEWRKAMAQGVEPALLTDAVLRRPLRQNVVRSLPDMAVVAYQEVPGDALLEPLFLLKPEDVA
jgi:flagellar biosynthesis protein FlhA